MAEDEREPPVAFASSIADPKYEPHTELNESGSSGATSGTQAGEYSPESTLVATSEGNTVSVEWSVRDAAEGDWLALYVHERLRDGHYFRRHNTHGAPSGSVVFHDLARGHYDVRFFRAGSAVRAEDIPMAVVRVGALVELSVTHCRRRELEVAWPPQFTDGGSWVALFRADEHSNMAARCIASKFLREAESAAPAQRLLLPAPRAPGEYSVRFFHRGSLGVGGSNAYSGVATVHVPNEDRMAATFDRTSMRCTVEWQALSVEPHKWQWIGLYDGAGVGAQRLTWEYVANHRYTTPEHDAGVVELKQVPPLLKQWALTGRMPPQVAHWQLRFHNSYLDTAQPLFTCPFVALPHKK